MTSYTTSLRLWQGTPFDPAIKGAWGTPLNTNDTLIEVGITGTSAVGIGGLTTYALTVANGASDQSRALVQNYTGALTAACTITLPNVPKIGWGQNSTTGGFNVIESAGGASTATLPADGYWYFRAADGAGNVTLTNAGFGALAVVGAAKVGGLLSANGGVKVPYGTAVTTADSGGTTRNLIGLSGTATTITSAGNGSLVFTNQGATQNLFSVDNAGTAYLGPGNTVTSPIISMIAGASWRPTAGFDMNVTTNATALAIGNSSTAIQPTLVAFYTRNATIVGTIVTYQGTTTYNTTSDQRLKLDDGLIALPEATEMIMDLRPRWFRWRSAPDDASQPGFFAQQVAKVFPWAVTKGARKRPWQMDNAKLVPILVAALQDAHRRIDALEGRVHGTS